MERVLVSSDYGFVAYIEMVYDVDVTLSEKGFIISNIPKSEVELQREYFGSEFSVYNNVLKSVLKRHKTTYKNENLVLEKIHG